MSERRGRINVQSMIRSRMFFIDLCAVTTEPIPSASHNFITYYLLQLDVLVCS